MRRAGTKYNDSLAKKRGQSALQPFNQFITLSISAVWSLIVILMGCTSGKSLKVREGSLIKNQQVIEDPWENNHDNEGNAKSAIAEESELNRSEDDDVVSQNHAGKELSRCHELANSKIDV